MKKHERREPLWCLNFRKITSFGNSQSWLWPKSVFFTHVPITKLGHALNRSRLTNLSLPSLSRDVMHYVIGDGKEADFDKTEPKQMNLLRIKTNKIMRRTYQVNIWRIWSTFNNSLTEKNKASNLEKCYELNKCPEMLCSSISAYGYWRCPCCMRSRVCVSFGCPSVRQSVCLSRRSTAAATCG